MTLDPSSTSLSAIAAPIPEVAPTIRTCLYGEDMFNRIRAESVYDRKERYRDIRVRVVSCTFIEGERSASYTFQDGKYQVP